MCCFADWVTLLSARCKYKIFLLDSFFEVQHFNPWIAELNPIWHLLALLGAHHILHISRIRVNQLQAARLFFKRITFAKPVKKFVALYEINILCSILYLFFFIPFSCLVWFYLDPSAVSDPFEAGISSKRSLNFRFYLRRHIMHSFNRTKY
jgi:hypothetical protein